MRLIRLSSEYIEEVIEERIGLRGPKLESCALTVGSFDGLHRGHQELMNGVRASQKEMGLKSGAIFTFMQHPRLVIDQQSEPFLLTTWREKLSLLQDWGCEVIVAVDFCPLLARLSYDEFVDKFLVKYLGMKHLVAGYDVHLGAGRQGTARSLAELGLKLGYTLEVFPPVRQGQDIISSSAIRRAVQNGNMPLAESMLGRPYTLWGEVVPGDSRGRQIGFPTANIQPLDPMKLLPETGVYAVRVQIPGDVVVEGTKGVLERVTESLPEVDLQGELLSAATAEWAVFGGMLNFGQVPTFHGGGLPEPRIEAHIFGFDGDLRGRNIKVDWISRLRGEKTFAGAEELIQQLHLDKSKAQEILGL